VERDGGEVSVQWSEVVRGKKRKENGGEFFVTVPALTNLRAWRKKPAKKWGLKAVEASGRRVKSYQN
jgi:hypothetical protein